MSDRPQDSSSEHPPESAKDPAILADSSPGGGNDLGDEDPWRLPAKSGAYAAAPETGTRRLFPRTRARSSKVSGGAELVIPECLVRLDANSASGAVSGVIESKSSAEPEPSPSAEASESPDEQSTESSATDSASSALAPPPGVRPRSNSQPAILVEDHELEEILEDTTSSSEAKAPAASAVPAAPAAPVAAPPPHPSSGDEEVEGSAAWHERFFEQGKGPIVASGGDEEAQRDVEFVALCAGLSVDQSVLDLGCGNGRHCFALVDQGYQVLGVDRSAHQLNLAKERNAQRVRKAEFVQGDFRSEGFAQELGRQFDVVTCLGSSFGYFSEEENLRCLEQMRECVKPGGAVLLHNFNRDFVVSKVPCRSWWSDSGFLVLDEVDYNYVAERLRVKRTMLGDDGVQTEHLIEIRAYALRELCLLLATAGLQVVEISGSRTTRGYYYGADSPDMWLVARRPA